MGLSVNAREIISANKGRLMGPSMQSLVPEDRAQVDNKFAPIVPGSRDLLRHQAALDVMQNMSASLGRNTPNLTNWADSRTNRGPIGIKPAKQAVVPPNNQQQNDDKAIGEIVSADAGVVPKSDEPKPAEEKQRDDESKGMLLMVVLGAALATVLVAFS
jgi:hypothetical protein